MRMNLVVGALFTFLIAGCADRHLPTGQHQLEYADSTAPRFSVATLIKKSFDPDTLVLEVDVERYTLQDEFRVPLILTTRGKELYWTEKEPLGNYKWISTKKGLAIDLLIGSIGQEISLKNQHAKEGNAKVDISGIFEKVKANAPIVVTCLNCSPYGVEAKKPDGLPISGPLAEISFELLLSEQEFKQARRATLARIEERKREEILALAHEEAKRKQKLQEEEDRRLKKIQEEERIAREGDGSPDDLLCKKYGFKPATTNYADCRLKLDLVRKEHAIEQQRLQVQQQSLQYQQRRDEAERRQRQREEFNKALSEIGNSFKPNPMHTYIGPGGHIVNCTTHGTVTNCF